MKTLIKVAVISWATVSLMLMAQYSVAASDFVGVRQITAASKERGRDRLVPGGRRRQTCYAW
ncbi:hypothetical protein QO004_002343 [Rhizobium mesoamericanum]|nr:hypothetical protein [Rhizobium mesoamericanum]